MKIKDRAGNILEMNVHPDGYAYYHTDRLCNQVDEIRSVELADLDIKTDKKGELYIHKKGQKRLNIGNARVTDFNNILVKDYLAKQQSYSVSLTFDFDVKGPDEVFALNTALNELYKKVLDNGPSIGFSDFNVVEN